MPRTVRRPSESDIYHVTARGTGQQRIFENDYDRNELLSLLSSEHEQFNVDVFAWCFMDNHIHLIVRADLADLSSFMRTVLGRYAMSFNMHHGRVGGLFQERFHSEPIATDEHFLAALRYVHNNPQKARMAKTQDYAWSSYKEYLGKPRVCSIGLALDMLGGKKAFQDFHAAEDDRFRFYDVSEPRMRLSDEVATDLVRDKLGSSILSTVAGMPKKERDEALTRMRKLGLSVRQIQRLTGIGHGIISRARM